MTIKIKLILAIALSVVSLSLMHLLSTTLSSTYEKTRIYERNINNIEKLVLQLRRNEKDFLARKQVKYVEKFNQNANKLNKAIKAAKHQSNELPQFTKLESAITNYQQRFREIVSTQKRIGLDHKTGLYGELRNAIHNVESLISNDKVFLANVLQLRRNEKDFMLRLDKKYVSRFTSNINALIEEHSLSENNTTISYLEQYRTTFLALVAEQVRLGLNEKTGLNGQMRAAVHQVDDLLIKLVKQSESELTTQTDQIKLTEVVVFALVLISTLLLNILLIRNILTKLSKIESTIGSIVNNNNLTEKIEVSGKDELAKIATNFNFMIEHLKALIENVNSSVSTVDESSHTIEHSVIAIEHGVNTQREETDMVATAVTEMVATIEDISANTQESAIQAEQTHQISKQGHNIVNSTLEQISDLQDKLNQSEKVVSSLANESETVTSVLDVIREIAEQTNLLALNAAIEAARAGEQGRGFAVVADEVRSLASRTQDSTKEIENIINSLQSQTKIVETQIKDCRQQGENCSQYAKKTGETFFEISNNVNTINDMTSTIATSIGQQSTVANELNEHVISIRDIAEKTNIQATNSTGVSQQLANETKQLKEAISVFKTH